MIPEFMEPIKDFIIFLAGSGMLAKVVIEWNISRKKQREQQIQINIDHTNNKDGNNNNGGSSGGNGKTQYATMRDLMIHAVECPKGIHSKIEEYNRELAQKIDANHHETMKTFAELQVSIATIKTGRRK